MGEATKAGDHIPVPAGEVGGTGIAKPLEQRQSGRLHGQVFCMRKTTQHRVLTSIRTTPDALLRLIQQRWSIENEWHWDRDAQLGEEAHRFANRIRAPVFAVLRTIVMLTKSAEGHSCSAAAVAAGSG
jgi:hypothetical protein